MAIARCRAYIRMPAVSAPKHIADTHSESAANNSVAGGQRTSAGLIEYRMWSAGELTKTHLRLKGLVVCRLGTLAFSAP